MKLPDHALSLQAGDYLTRPEFERRYHAQPNIKKAELIEGILRSRLFPGLWLQPAAIWANDLSTLLAVLQQGLASPEHGVFVEKLKAQLTA